MKLLYLILVEIAFAEFGFALLLKCDDNQGDEDIDEKEREHDEEHHIKERDFESKERRRSLILIGRIDRILSYHRPAFAGRHNEQCEHCVERVVVVEWSQTPFASLDTRRLTLEDYG